MRINYKYGIRTISGKLDDLVHMAWNKGRVAIGRVFVMPTLVVQHFLFRDIKQNLASVWAELTVDFKNDLKLYASKRVPFYTAEQIPAYANYAHFIRFIYNFAKTDETLDLTLADKMTLEAAGIPTTVAGLVDGGYLPTIPDAEALSNAW